MNIGFAAVAVLLSLIPGLAFRESYFSGSFSKRYVPSRALQELAAVVLISAVAHLAFQNLPTRYEGIQPGVMFDCWMSGQNQALADMCRHESAVITHYFLFVALWSAWIGYAFQKFIRFFKIDRRTDVFRFQNPWYYILSGEILDFHRAKSVRYTLANRPIDAIVIDILKDFGGCPYLYTGLLYEYFLGNDGKLQMLLLKDVFRVEMKSFDTMGQLKMKRVNIDGTYMAFNAEEIINYNVTYLTKDGAKKFHRMKRLWRYVRVPLLLFVVLYSLWKFDQHVLKGIHYGISFL